MILKKRYIDLYTFSLFIINTFKSKSNNSKSKEFAKTY